MSLILEALRKSEAQRRRGQVPSLHAERAPALPPARATRPGWPWLALAVIAVFALAWLARSAWPPPRAAEPPRTEVARPATDTSDDADKAARATNGASDAGRSTYGPFEAEANPPTTAGTTPPPQSAASVAVVPLSPHPADIAAIAGTDADADAPMSMRSPRAITPAPPARNGSDASIPAIAPPGPAATATTAPRPSPQPVPAVTLAVQRPRAPIPASTAATTVTPTPASPALGALLRLSDLSTAERLELPPLKMSMHLWDPMPARRFAIIDGARVNEGDRLGDAVVDEITASAVVLAWRGQRLRIPLR